MAAGINGQPVTGDSALGPLCSRGAKKKPHGFRSAAEPISAVDEPAVAREADEIGQRSLRVRGRVVDDTGACVKVGLGVRVRRFRAGRRRIR